MKLLHTSDWHLGRNLYGRQRYKEFSLFLDWMIETLEDQKIDILLIAGDIFDTTTPGNRAQELYYKFLCQVASTGCSHIVITAGNHDSPTFLDAPGALLQALNIHVVGELSEEREVLLLDVQGQKILLCPVPYLRDRDIRQVEAGETAEDKSRKLAQGIQDHYGRVVDRALEIRQSQDNPDTIPLVAMGHLFTAGGKTVDKDGVRELYVGSLAHLGEDVFPSSIDYLALGHLHVPQIVHHCEHRRYSGSPLPMGFGEAGQDKMVIAVEFKGTERTITPLKVPTFQSLEKVKGDLGEIQGALELLKMGQNSIWLEIEYTGEPMSTLRELLEELVQGTQLDILRIKNKALMDRVLSSDKIEESLDDLNESLVFERCLDAFEIPPEERSEYLRSYGEILQTIHEGEEL